MVIQIRSVKVNLEIDTNKSTHKNEFDLHEYKGELDIMLEDVKAEIKRWLELEGK